MKTFEFAIHFFGHLLIAVQMHRRPVLRDFENIGFATFMLLKLMRVETALWGAECEMMPGADPKGYATRQVNVDLGC